MPTSNENWKLSFCTSKVAKSVKTRKPINCCYVSINSKLHHPPPRADPGNLNFLKFDWSNSPPPVQKCLQMPHCNKKLSVQMPHLHMKIRNSKYKKYKIYGNVFRQDSEIHVKSLDTLWKFNSFTQLCSTYLQMKHIDFPCPFLWASFSQNWGRFPRNLRKLYLPPMRSIFCACRKHAKTGKILRLPVQIPHPVIKCPTTWKT